MSMKPTFEVELDLAMVADPPTNPNSMSDKDYRALVHVIETEGFFQPILVQKLTTMYQIVDGVHRTKAAREVGLTHVPALVLPVDYPEEKIRLLQVGMNKLRGDLDHTQVAQMFQELGDDWDLTLSGFDAKETKVMIDAINAPTLDDLMEEGMEETEIVPPEPAASVFVLEIEFTDKSQMQAAKKELRRIGGKDLSVGLLSSLDI